jgi:hypothetical protein
MNHPDRELKTLIFDMELSYSLYFAFPSNKPQFLHSSQLHTSAYVPCFSWKWEHQHRAHAMSVLDDKKQFKNDYMNDYALAVKLHSLMDEADIIVAHNADRFDIKQANTLFIKHGLGPISEYKSVDTLKVVKKYFAFEGNSLQALCDRFEIECKGEKPCWKKLTLGDPKEIKKTAKYCLQDTYALEGVLHHIRPYIKRYPTLRRPHEAVTECAGCKSKRLQNRGSAFNGTVMYFRVKCMECGMENPSKKRFKS